MGHGLANIFDSSFQGISPEILNPFTLPSYPENSLRLLVLENSKSSTFLTLYPMEEPNLHNPWQLDTSRWLNVLGDGELTTSQARLFYYGWYQLFKCIFLCWYKICSLGLTSSWS